MGGWVDLDMMQLSIELINFLININIFTIEALVKLRMKKIHSFPG